jgi:hypothetical protein
VREVAAERAAKLQFRATVRKGVLCLLGFRPPPPPSRADSRPVPRSKADRIMEPEVNPLIVSDRPGGSFVVDARARLAGPSTMTP